MASEIWLTAEEQRAWRRFVRMQMLLTARLGRDLQEDSGLSASDYEVLVDLSEAPDSTMRAFELGRVLQWEKSRLSHHLTRMEGRGLIRREECTTDARGAFVVLTAAGRDAIERAAPLHVRSVRRHVLDHLSAAQLRSLDEIVGAVLAHLEPPAEPGTAGG